MQKLAEDLKNLSLNQKNQNIEIDNLYLELDEINRRKQYIKFPYCPCKNLFNNVRPEVIFQILQFVDLKTFVQFRLINRQCDQIIQIISPLKAQQIESQIKILVADLENFSLKYEQSNQNNDDQYLQGQLDMARQNLQQLQREHITEIRTLCKPPAVLQKVCYYLLIFLNERINEIQDIWREAKIVLAAPHIVNQITKIEPGLISEQQLAKFVDFDQLIEQQVQACSYATHRIYLFMKTVIDIRKSERYIIKYKAEWLKFKIYQQTRNIGHLSWIGHGNKMA